MFLNELFYKSAELNPDKTAISFGNSQLTYENLFDQHHLIASFLLDNSFHQQDRALIILPNCTEFFPCHFGIMAAGGISVPLDEMVSQEVLGKIVKALSPKAIFISDLNYRRFELFFKTLDIAICIIGETNGSPIDSKSFNYSEVLMSTKKIELPKLSSDFISTIMHTSGSTGTPKGVKLSHENTTYTIKHIANYLEYSSRDCEVVTLPVSHSFGLGHVYCNLLSGGRVHLERGLLRIGRTLNSLEELNATGFPGTPLGYGLLLDRYSDILKSKGKGLRFIVINSASLPPNRAKQILCLLPHVRLLVYYGLTEASRSTFMDLSIARPNQLTSVGRSIMPDVKLVIGSPIEPLPPKEIGEILISGPNVTNGFWGDDGQTNIKLESNWLRTGDLGYFDSEGFLYLNGRTNDVINVGGYKIYPNEVEDVLKNSIFFDDIGVVGVLLNSNSDSQIVVACIVKSNFESNEKDWIKISLQFLEPYKVPTKFIVVKKIPRLDSGKIQRNILKTLAEEMLRGEDKC